MPAEMWTELDQQYANSWRTDPISTEVLLRQHSVLPPMQALSRRLLDLEADLRHTRAQRDQLREHILDIDAHATPYGDIPDDSGWTGTYLLTAGALHRALGKIGHSAPSCQAQAQLADIHRHVADLDAQLAAAQPVLDAARHIVSGWKQIFERGLTSDMDDALDEAEHQLAAAVDALEAMKPGLVETPGGCTDG
jgi:hypothetical protein